MTWERAFAEIPCRRSGGELGEVLVGHGDRQPVGAGLGQHVFQRVGQVQEVLRLVDVQAGVGPGGLGDAGAAGGGLPGAGDDEGADQLGGFLAEDAFGQPGQAQPAVVEDVGHVEGGRPGGDGLPGELRSRNARSLFISGPMECARVGSDSCSYQSQKPRSTGSRMPAVRRWR